jgi:DNA-binding NarL/FixJ family response regulator
VPITVLIADDDPVMRMLVSAIVARDPDLTLAGEAEDADQAIAQAERLRPDVALLDLEMPGGGGPAAAHGIRERVPATKVLALSAHEADAARDEMTAAGVVGYVVKGAPPDAVAAAIKASVTRP